MPVLLSRIMTAFCRCNATATLVCTRCFAERTGMPAVAAQPWAIVSNSATASTCHAPKVSAIAGMRGTSLHSRSTFFPSITMVYLSSLADRPYASAAARAVSAAFLTYLGWRGCVTARSTAWNSFLSLPAAQRRSAGRSFFPAPVLKQTSLRGSIWALYISPYMTSRMWLCRCPKDPRDLHVVAWYPNMSHRAPQMGQRRSTMKTGSPSRSNTATRNWSAVISVPYHGLGTASNQAPARRSAPALRSRPFRRYGLAHGACAMAPTPMPSSRSLCWRASILALN